MVIDHAVLDQYFATCAADIGRSTIAAIVKVESAANPWAIHDSAKPVLQQPGNYYDAVSTAKSRIALGHSVDMGLGQVNSRNLARLGVTVNEIFEPCRNLVAASTILKACYVPAQRRYGDGQRALIHALSCYNTGSLFAGRSYVDRILAAAGADKTLKTIAAATLTGGTQKPRPGSVSSLMMNLNSDDWRIFE